MDRRVFWVRSLGAALLGLALGVALVAAACGDDQEEQPSAAAAPERLSIDFMAGFRAQANLPFVAVYVAQQEGFFDAVGLDVTINHSAQGEHIQLLLDGAIDITTQPASELLQRRADPGAPLVAVALFGQTGDLGYAVLEESGITSPRDFAGKIVGFKGVVQAEFLAMLATNGLSQSNVELVSVGFNPVVLSEKEVDVYPVFLSNEPDILTRVIGVPIRVFKAADYGVPTLGVTYVVSEDFLQDANNREALRRFLLATMKGFQFALDNPDLAVVDTKAFIAADADLVHERFILTTELGNAVSGLTDSNGLGWFTQEQFQALYDVLVQYGAITKEIDVSQAIDRSILESIYQNESRQFPE